MTYTHHTTQLNQMTNICKVPICPFWNFREQNKRKKTNFKTVPAFVDRRPHPLFWSLTSAETMHRHRWAETEFLRPWSWPWGISRTTHHVLGLGFRGPVLGLDLFLEGQAIVHRGNTLGLDPFSSVCLDFYVDWISFMDVGWYGYVDHRFVL